jgi:hypothetical protein
MKVSLPDQLMYNAFIIQAAAVAAAAYIKRGRDFTVNSMHSTINN